MSDREGIDRLGDAWAVVPTAKLRLVHLTLYDDETEVVHTYTPGQARALAKALSDLADELDPRAAPPCLQAPSSSRSGRS
jgi:hypothetical protein